MQPVGQRLLQLIRGFKTVALPAQAQIIDQVLGGIDAAIGHQQGGFELFEQVFVDLAPTEQARQTAPQLLARTRQARLEPIPPGAPGRWRLGLERKRCGLLDLRHSDLRHRDLGRKLVRHLRCGHGHGHADRRRGRGRGCWRGSCWRGDRGFGGRRFIHRSRRVGAQVLIDTIGARWLAGFSLFGLAELLLQETKHETLGSEGEFRVDRASRQAWAAVADRVNMRLPVRLVHGAPTPAERREF